MVGELPSGIVVPELTPTFPESQELLFMVTKLKTIPEASTVLSVEPSKLTVPEL